jgi:hypothetical protein
MKGNKKGRPRLLEGTLMYVYANSQILLTRIPELRSIGTTKPGTLYHVEYEPAVYLFVRKSRHSRELLMQTE